MRVFPRNILTTFLKISILFIITTLLPLSILHTSIILKSKKNFFYEYPKKLIETKINKLLEDYRIDNNTFKQNQTTKSRTKSSQEN